MIFYLRIVYKNIVFCFFLFCFFSRIVYKNIVFFCFFFWVSYKMGNIIKNLSTAHARTRLYMSGQGINSLLLDSTVCFSCGLPDQISAN